MEEEEREEILARCIPTWSLGGTQFCVSTSNWVAGRPRLSHLKVLLDGLSELERAALGMLAWVYDGESRHAVLSGGISPWSVGQIRFWVSSSYEGFPRLSHLKVLLNGLHRVEREALGFTLERDLGEEKESFGKEAKGGDWKSRIKVKAPSAATRAVTELEEQGARVVRDKDGSVTAMYFSPGTYFVSPLEELDPSEDQLPEWEAGGYTCRLRVQCKGKSGIWLDPTEATIHDYRDCGKQMTKEQLGYCGLVRLEEHQKLRAKFLLVEKRLEEKEERYRREEMRTEELEAQITQLKMSHNASIDRLQKQLAAKDKRIEDLEESCGRHSACIDRMGHEAAGLLDKMKEALEAVVESIKQIPVEDANGSFNAGVGCAYLKALEEAKKQYESLKGRFYEGD